MSARFGVVVDNSVIAAWALGEASPYAYGVMDALGESTAWVPAIWPFEFANTVVAALRRGRIDAEQLQRLLRVGEALPLSIEPASERIVSTGSLARDHGLSAYDAAYLDLAMRNRMPLATLDERLRSAALGAGVALI